MQEQQTDVYVLIERTKQSDPGAFAMKTGPDGMPAGFADPDPSRRRAAYITVCNELEVPEHLRLKAFIRA